MKITYEFDGRKTTARVEASACAGEILTPGTIGVVGNGTATAEPGDVFDYTVGRKIASGRAIQDFGEKLERQGLLESRAVPKQKTPRPDWQQTATWTTAEGDVVRIGQLEDEHLVNIIKMIRRRPGADRVLATPLGTALGLEVTRRFFEQLDRVIADICR